jgi:hypothetical protein
MVIKKQKTPLKAGMSKNRLLQSPSYRLKIEFNHSTILPFYDYYYMIKIEFKAMALNIKWPLKLKVFKNFRKALTPENGYDSIDKKPEYG